MQAPQVLIVDLGSQYTSVIARILRQMGVRSAILDPKKAGVWLRKNRPRGIILSGGPASVYQEGAPEPPESIFKWKVPILGICYGMQWLAKHLGGQVEASLASTEYGEVAVRLDLTDTLFDAPGAIENPQTVWASHGDSVTRVPRGFKVTSHSMDGQTITSMASRTRRIWGFQFHPEVPDTPNGEAMLREFIFGVCSCDSDWKPGDMITEIQERVRRAVGGKKAIIALSGGVDSTTLAKILAPVLGRRLLAITIDTGGLREGDLEDAIAAAKAAGVQLRVVRAASRFQRALAGITNPEAKRKRFRRVYAQILDEEGKRFSATFLIQGTLAPDLIESGRVGRSALIKTHHNTGLKIRLRQLHPFSGLFKYEVREFARLLNLPHRFCERQPFPGPGLYVRIPGHAATRRRLQTLRWADREVRAILDRHGSSSSISQLVVGLFCTPTIGVKGDHRAEQAFIGVRAVRTIDYMTAQGLELPTEVRREIKRTLPRHGSIVNVAFFEGDKPPATIEFE